MSTDFWMPLYIGRYLKDTLHLSTLQHGAYCLLLMHYWVSGPLPDDDAQLAAIAKLDKRSWKSMSAVLRKFFRSQDGMLYQKRAEIERAKAEKLTTGRSAAGKTGAEARWHTNNKPPDDPNGNGMANASQTHTEAIGNRYAHLPIPKQEEENTSSSGLRKEDARDDFVGSEATGAVVRNVKFGLRQAHPPRKAKLDIHDQVDAIGPKTEIRSAYLSGAFLAEARRKAAAK